MENTGMMKMATGDGSPLRQGTGKGFQLVFRGSGGLRRRNSRSIFCSGSFRVRRYIWVKGERRWSYEGPTRQGAHPGGRARPPPSWAPCCSTDVLLPPIYTYVPANYQIRSQKPNSTAATFCTREIPSWGLFRSSAGGGIDHGGLLHQHHSLSDDVWVVYHRPSGP